MCNALLRALALFAVLIVVAPAEAAHAEDAANVQKNVAKDPRQALADAGIQFSATYIGEGLANVSGGVRAGRIYTGRLDLGTTIDLEKIAGWTGATFHANMFQIHGDGLSGSYIGNLMLVSGVEALPSTRLYELWIEQKLLGGKLAIRVGQQASDVEFFDSTYDDMFVNSALGLARHYRHHSAGRRAFSAACGAGHSPQGRTVRQDHSLSRAVRWRCGASGFARSIRSLPIPMASCFASTIRPGGSASSNTNSRSEKANCPQRSRGAPGTT